MEASEMKVTLIAIRNVCNNNEVSSIRQLYKLTGYKNTSFYTFLTSIGLLIKNDKGFYKMVKKLNINIEFTQNLIEQYQNFKKKEAVVIDLHPAAKVIPLNPPVDEPLLLNTETNTPIVEEHANEEIQVVSDGFSQGDDYLQSRELPDIIKKDQSAILDDFKEQLFPENTNSPEAVVALKEVVKEETSKKSLFQRIGDWFRF